MKVIALISGKSLMNSTLASFRAKDAHFGNDFRGYSLVNCSCNPVHPLPAEGLAAGAEKSTLGISHPEVGPNSKPVGIYSFSAMAALAACFPPLIGIIACSYGVPAHIMKGLVGSGSGDSV